MNFGERKTVTPSIKVRNTHIPVVKITRSALNKMFLFTKEITTEVGWLGTAYREGKIITIKDVYLLAQEVHATTTELTPEGLTAFATELLAKPDGVEIWNNIKMWGHSHVNMGITPSGQDNSQMEVFANSGHGFFVRLICNKKGELAVDVYDYEHGIETHNAKWAIEEDVLNEKAEEISEQIKEVKELLENLYKLKGTEDEAVLKELEESLKEEIKTKVKPFRSKHTTGANTSYTHKARVRPTVDLIDNVKVTIYDIFTVKDLQDLGRASRTYIDIEDELIALYPEVKFSYQDLVRILAECRKVGGMYDYQYKWGRGYY